ncbi:translation elongation factor Ts [Pararhizobium mangrovi]|uniref:Elongation factor Ts n=1 Tax=Pararhizobium mangrovi TaxID=2590452 RepID=A0A506UE35_9HYPH|nr:translation elongation factor Ts [Pararhizobium mangrovi]TPW31214.1 elongation factor Ts [Pararhizobium mangrovi]
MAISASQVKELREKTGAGMMDCKKALSETDGDMDAAVDWLRAKGISKAEKKSDRATAEGLIGVAAGENEAVLVEVNSETDFVARNETFQKLVAEIAGVGLSTDGSVEAISGATLPSSGQPVSDTVRDAVGTIGENMTFRRAQKLSVEKGAVASYIHNAVGPDLGKLGVLVALRSEGDRGALEKLGKQIAMHVAATNPLSLTKDDVAPEVAERERRVFAEQARESGKPDSIVEKMVEGRMRKFYEEVALLSQDFVVNPDQTVSEAVSAAEAEAGAPITVEGFVRFSLGEGVEAQTEGAEAA